jgi:hypothetical protein
MCGFHISVSRCECVSVRTWEMWTLVEGLMMRNQDREFRMERNDPVLFRRPTGKIVDSCCEKS